MKKLLVFVLIVWGAAWYAKKHFSVQKVLDYARRHESARWSPPVQYGIGMGYYARSDEAQAQKVFSQFVTDYSTGPYVSDALLRLSEVAEDNHDWQTAKDSLDRFIQNYPHDPNYQMAVKRRELLYNK